MARRDRPNRAAAVAWFESFVDAYGQVMPDSNEIHLPTQTPQKVFDLYKTHFKNESSRVCKETLTKLIRVDYPNIVFPKWSRFAKCSTCETLRDKIENADNLYIKSIADESLKIHQALFKQERKELYRQIQATSELGSDKFFFMMDGMDNSKTTLPHRHIKIKAWESKKLLKTHVTGGMSYTGNLEPEVFAWTWHDDYHKGVNVTASQIMRMLACAPQPLRPILHFQFDNCVSENKNQLLFCFFSWMIANGYAKEIHVSYLPVGHTHDKVDQFFSRLALWLRLHNATTLDDYSNKSRHCLMEALKLCYATNPPTCRSMQECADFETFFTPFSAGIHNFTDKRYFKFAMNSSQQPRMWYKKSLTSTKPWKGGEDSRGKPDDSLGIDCFKNGIIPRGVPRPQQPHRFKNWTTVLSDLKSTFTELEPGDIEWWKQYLQRLEHRFTTPVDVACVFFPFDDVAIIPWTSKRVIKSCFPTTMPEQLFCDSDEEEHVYAGEYRPARPKAGSCAKVGDLVAVSVEPSQHEPYGFSIARILKLHTGPGYEQEELVDKDSFNFTAEWLYIKGRKTRRRSDKCTLLGSKLSLFL